MDLLDKNGHTGAGTQLVYMIIPANTEMIHKRVKNTAFNSKRRNFLRKNTKCIRTLPKLLIIIHKNIWQIFKNDCF